VQFTMRSGLTGGCHEPCAFPLYPGPASVAAGGLQYPGTGSRGRAAAQSNLQEVTRLVQDPRARAEAHFSAYRAALERKYWEEALAELKQALADNGQPAGKGLSPSRDCRVTARLTFPGAKVLVDSKLEILLNDRFAGMGYNKGGFDFAIETTVGAQWI